MRSLCLVLLVISSYAVTIVDIPPEITGTISRYLTFDQQLNARFISQRFNHQFDYTHFRTINVIQSILNSSNGANQSQIERMRRYNELLAAFDPLSLLKLPQITSKVDYQNYTHVSSSKVMPQHIYKVWKNESIEIQALALSSLVIQNRFSNRIEHNLIRDQIWMQTYVYSYHFASTLNPQLPDIMSLFYLPQNKDISLKQKQLDYIRYLQTKVGIIFWHPNIAKQAWCNDTFDEYLRGIKKTSDYLQKSIGDRHKNKYLFNYYTRGWLHNCLTKLFNSSFDLTTYVDDVEVVQMIYVFVHRYVRRGWFDILETFFVGLKNNDGLELLENEEFPVIIMLVEEMDERLQIGLFETLIRVSMMNTLDAHVIHTLAVSLSWWKQGAEGSSIVILHELANEKYFNKDLVEEMENIHAVYRLLEKQDEYFLAAFDSLYKLRQDWYTDAHVLTLHLTNRAFRKLR